MAKTDLTAQRLREVLHYDPETGVFTRRQKTSIRGEFGDKVGWHTGNGYLMVTIDYGRHYLHRLAFLYQTNKFPRKHVDHIDGDGRNNRWSNLRDVSVSVNMQNIRAASKNSSTGLLGIEKARGGGWVARIMVDRKRFHIGTYTTQEEAHDAYIAAKRRLHEGCTI